MLNRGTTSTASPPVAPAPKWWSSIRLRPSNSDSSLSYVRVGAKRARSPCSGFSRRRADAASSWATTSVTCGKPVRCAGSAAYGRVWTMVVNRASVMRSSSARISANDAERAGSTATMP